MHRRFLHTCVHAIYRSCTRPPLESGKIDFLFSYACMRNCTADRTTQARRAHGCECVNQPRRPRALQPTEKRVDVSCHRRRRRRCPLRPAARATDFVYTTRSAALLRPRIIARALISASKSHIVCIYDAHKSRISSVRAPVLHSFACVAFAGNDLQKQRPQCVCVRVVLSRSPARVRQTGTLPHYSYYALTHVVVGRLSLLQCSVLARVRSCSARAIYRQCRVRSGPQFTRVSSCRSCSCSENGVVFSCVGGCSSIQLSSSCVDSVAQHLRERVCACGWMVG